MDTSNYNWGVIGNCRSAAVIDADGDVIWLCLPEFDSDALFAAILDDKNGGRWGFRFDGAWRTFQRYLRDTNILVTRFMRLDDTGAPTEDIFEVHDLMPRYRHTGRTDLYFTAPEMIRYLKHISGTPTFKIHYDPRLLFGVRETATEIHPAYIKSWSTGGSYESVYLYSDLSPDAIVDGVPLTLERDAFMELSYHQKIIPQTMARTYLKMEKTKVYWLDWVDSIGRFAKYHDDIVRSALVLKLMTFQGSGAVIAALTTSLPETIGASRNWDYRFCWIRDASMTVAVFSDLKHRNTVRRYLTYILNLLSTKDQEIQIMYGIRGEKQLVEKTLGHLEGYLGSKPVRVGNAAFTQAQHDVYGILLDVILKSLEHLDFRYDALEDIWTIVRMLARTVSRVWREPDNGIWEFRGQQRHFVFSKVMCWVAMERSARIAEKLGMDDYVERWQAVRDEIRADILENGWNDEVSAFTQSYDSTQLDASNLLMEYYGFIDAADPKFVSTVLRSKEHLCEGGLMYRYRTEDDFGLPESSFTVCTFWLVYSLHRIGEVEEARSVFEGVLAKRNPLGLLSEDIRFEDGRLLGNFPQAYSHLALIACAALLAKDGPCRS